MKFKTIQWQNHPDYPLVYQGMIGDQELFTITDITKKDIGNFQLQSSCIKSNTFYCSATLKPLGEFRTINLAKVEAQLKWDEFINSLIEFDIPVTKEEMVS